MILWAPKAIPQKRVTVRRGPLQRQEVEPNSLPSVSGEKWRVLRMLLLAGVGQGRRVSLSPLNPVPRRAVGREESRGSNILYIILNSN